nr:hypothetical protein Iba_chr12fCG20030 [Ipomoea batatas]
MTQKVLVKAYPPTPLEDDLDDYVGLRNATPQLVAIAIIGATSVVLFKKKYIDGPGFCRAFWMLMLIGSVVLDSTEDSSLTTPLILLHILVNSLGLSYWIVLDVNEYKRKKTWPSMELLFETGVWLFMVILSWVEFMSWRLFKDKEFFHAYYLYPIAIALISMIEKYFTKKREIDGGDELKSELTENRENDFDDLVRSCLKDPQNDNITDIDQKINDFTRMLSVLAAQWQEAPRVRGSRVEPKAGASTSKNDQEIVSMDL